MDVVLESNPPLLLQPPPLQPSLVAAALPAALSDLLPDVLRAELHVVFVGTAAGARSAREGAYYAHPGNAFWPTLRSVELVPPRFDPHDFGKLLDVGIGFTDLCKSAAGSDAQVRITAADLASFNAKMQLYQPRAIAFTGKKAASLWLRRRTSRIRYGLQKQSVADFCEVFVLPSTSPAARRYWKIEPWHQLADWLRATQPWRF